MNKDELKNLIDNRIDNMLSDVLRDNNIKTKDFNITPDQLIEWDKIVSSITDLFEKLLTQNKVK